MVLMVLLSNFLDERQNTAAEASAETNFDLSDSAENHSLTAIATVRQPNFASAN